jgi:hypothetical protein
MRVDIDDEVIRDLLRVLRGVGEDIARVAAGGDPLPLRGLFA